MSAITEVNIDFIKPRDGLIGFASITFDNKLFLGCIGIHKKANRRLSYNLSYEIRAAFIPPHKQRAWEGYRECHF